MLVKPATGKLQQPLPITRAPELTFVANRAGLSAN